jgi:hypothetical protein
MKTYLKLSLSCVLALFWAGSVTGASLVYEGFDYLPSPLTGRNGGSGFAGPWLADPGVIVQPPALSTPLGQPSTGLAVGGSGFDSARQLSSPLNLADYWASFQIQGVPGNDQVFLGLDVGPSPLPLVSFGRILSTYFIRQGSGPIVQGGIGSPPGFTDLLVARFHQIGPGTAVDLWVNPTDFTLPPLVSLVVPTVFYSFVDMQVQPGFLADEVRIGTTSFDVSAVPEPSSLTLLVLAMCGLLWARRVVT